MATYKSPGVYVEEISTFPPSVAEVSTAIPAFIGYTEKGPNNQPTRISSMVEFEDLFGGPSPAAFEVDVAGDGSLTIKRNGTVTDGAVDAVGAAQPGNGKLGQGSTQAMEFLMYYCLKMFFNNGGGPCYIVSVGDTATDTWDKSDFETGIDLLEKEDEPTLFVLADAINLTAADYLGLCQRALDQCGVLKDRFTIIDVPQGSGDSTDSARILKDSGVFRDVALGTQMKYGASYYPYLRTTLNYAYEESGVTVNWPPTYQQVDGIKVVYLGEKESAKLIVEVSGSEPDFAFNVTLEPGSESIAKLEITMKAGTGKQLAAAWQKWNQSNASAGFQIEPVGTGSASVTAVTEETLKRPRNTLESLAGTSTQIYNQIKAALAKERIVLPPSSAMAGIYAKVDRERGVWKAPANVSVASVIGPTVKITHNEQEGLNVDPTAGKSINAIRSFVGKGTLVWGARTLAGNDNEWRYINVRRLFNMIEESTQKATAFAVFEANDATTWLKVKGMIESYLYGLWEQGALAGPTPDSAYFVNAGLGKTMTTQDVLEGRMIVEIGVAAVRPAEFIILRFTHKLQEA